MKSRRNLIKQSIPMVLSGAVLLMATSLPADAGGERRQRWHATGTAVDRTAAVGGAVIGGDIGRAMDRVDRLYVQRTLETSRTGHWVNWTNPGSGTEYTLTPTRTFRSSRLGDCRDYQAWVFIGGYEQEVTGTACRRADGIWQMVAR